MLSKKLRTILIYTILRLLHKLYYLPGTRAKRYIIVDNQNFVLLPYVFIPKYTLTSSMLCRVLTNIKGKSICELGSGSGLVSVYLSRVGKASRVMALDVKYDAVINTKLNAKINNVMVSMDIAQMDVGSAIRSNIFDIVVTNPPYLPLNPTDSLDILYCCGRDLKLLRKFIIDALRLIKNNGRVFMVLNDIALEYIVTPLRKSGLKVNKILQVKTLLDKIYVIEIKK